MFEGPTSTGAGRRTTGCGTRTGPGGPGGAGGPGRPGGPGAARTCLRSCQRLFTCDAGPAAVEREVTLRGVTRADRLQAEQTGGGVTGPGPVDSRHREGRGGPAVQARQSRGPGAGGTCLCSCQRLFSCDAGPAAVERELTLRGVTRADTLQAEQTGGGVTGPGAVDQLGSPGPVDQLGSPGPVDQRQSGPGGLASLRPRDSGQIETRNAAGHRRMDRSRGPAGQ